jgi:hypothetical protein
MRYKIRAHDEGSYQALVRHLTNDAAVEVLLTSPRRHFIATGDIPQASRQAIRDMGGEIVEDVQYDIESAR